MTFTPLNALTAFLNTSIVFSEDESQRLYELTKLATDTANYVNIREIAQYELVELLTGQQFSDATNANVKKFTFRKTFYIGIILAGGTTAVNHGITGITQCTHIYGTVVTAAPDFRPLPYVSATDVTEQISVRVTATQYIIVVGAASPNVTSGILVLEYLKN